MDQGFFTGFAKGAESLLAAAITTIRGSDIACPMITHTRKVQWGVWILTRDSCLVIEYFDFWDLKIASAIRIII